MSELKKHEHSIYDTDPHFKIDPVNMVITTDSKKVSLMKGDHNCERFTFEMPKEIEGHDMSLCDKIQIHYINIGSGTDRLKDIHEVDDFQVSPESDDVMIFSWLLDGNACKYTGTLSFAIVFKCTEDDIVVYQKSSDIFKGITVKDTINNSDAVVDDYSDILQKWYDQLFNGEGGSGTGEPGADGKSAYEIALDNGFEGSEQEWLESLNGADGIGIASIVQTVISTEDGGENTVVIKLTNGQPAMFKFFNGSKGSDGKDGAKGDKGDTGEKGEQGIQGEKGSDGVGITDVVIEDGNLIITMSDNGTLNLGKVVGDNGSDGKDGTDGADGIGITSVVQTTTSDADNGENIVTVTLTNGQTATFTVKNGSKGSQGIQGVQGEKGDQGIQGEVGPQGPKGDTGETGPQGIQGEQGIQGIKGEKGEKGDKGDTGADGSDYVLTNADKQEIAGMVDVETEVSDQLDGAKADIVTEIISQLGGLPVFGTVNDDNTITVTSALADGTYTLMYEYEDGTISEVGTIVVEQEIIKESYTNIIDTVGYTDGVRLSTSTGETKTQTDYVTTGIIDVTDLSTPIVIRTKGVDFSQDYAAIVSYQEDGSINSAGIIPTLASGTSGHASLDSDGNVTLNVSNWTSATRFRICGYGSGENLIVTINEEITDNTVSAYTNLADTSDEMWVENYRINSSGNTVEVTEDQRGDDTIVMTNLIDISSVSNSTKIHLKSLDMLSNRYTRIYFYDSNKNYLTFWQPAGNYVSTYLNVSDYNTDVQIVTKLNQLIDNLNLTDVSYIRFGGILTNTAENVIITIDEEIV